MHVVREGTPATDIKAGITKYDGKTKEPEWMDIERGRAFSSVAPFLHLALTIQKTTLRPCAMLLLTFLGHRAHSRLGSPGICATTESTWWCC